jgi:hypothetical protein
MDFRVMCCASVARMDILGILDVSTSGVKQALDAALVAGADEQRSTAIPV